MRTTRHPVTRHDVAAALAITPDQASAVLSRLWRAGDVRRREVPARERYARRPFVLYTASASR